MLLYYIFSNVLIWIILSNQHLINCPILNNKRVTNPTFLLEKNIKTAEWVVKEKKLTNMYSMYWKNDWK